MKALNSIKKLVNKHKWASGILCVCIATLCGNGLLIQLPDYLLKRDAARLDKARAVRESAHNRASCEQAVYALLPTYYPLCDKYLANPKDYETQNRFVTTLGTLMSILHEYNEAEARIAEMDHRFPSFFLPTLASTSPLGPAVHIVTNSVGKVDYELYFTMKINPLSLAMANDLEAICKEHRSREPWNPMWPKVDTMIFGITNLDAQVEINLWPITNHTPDTEIRRMVPAHIGFNRVVL
jgi:hypothetical protein